MIRAMGFEHRKAMLIPDCGWHTTEDCLPLLQQRSIALYSVPGAPGARQACCLLSSVPCTGQHIQVLAVAPELQRLVSHWHAHA